MPRLAHLVFFGLFQVLLTWAPVAWAQAAVPVLRISTENAEDHVQTRSIARFIAQLKLKAGKSLAVEFYPEARLFRDRDVIRALEQGRVEMALPGIWQFDRFVPDLGLFFLPLLYGQEDGDIDRLRDGDIGTALNRKIEGALDVKVLGRWTDLGAAHLFTLKVPIRHIGDFAGLVIRTPGGEASAMRLAAQGAKPISVAWPDLPGALDAGQLDGLVTTFETVASARLWEHGLQYAYEDRAYFAQYLPLVSARFWNRLKPALRKIIQDSWEANVAPSRAAAGQAQLQAKALLVAQGVAIRSPTPLEREAARQRLLERQDEMVKALDIDPALVDKASRLLEPRP